MSTRDIRTAADWERHYVEGRAPWDLGRAPPALERLAASLAGAPLEVFVPGAGRGHDAIAWARAGHRVTALDLAPTAVAEGRALAAAAGGAIEWIVGDLLALPADLDGCFDAAWEQTCLCALDPAQRRAYARAVARVLRPGGVLHGVTWEHGRPGGPPWDLPHAAVREALEGAFEIEALEPLPDWSPQRWNESLLRARRR